MNKKRLLFYPLLALAVGTLMGTGCSSSNAMFTYEEAKFEDKFGQRTNAEVYDYDSLKVNRLEEDLREDFAFGVDASMTKTVLENGGVYFNKDGKEQDLFQILKRNGVNFVRFRLWNNPTTKYGDKYGGGDNDVENDIFMARMAKEANLNVLIDFHYSDFWADPDKQNVPKEWGSLLPRELPEAIKTFTTETLQKFKDSGVTVDAVQIGNETNNGMAGYGINWNNTSESFDQIAKMMQAGIDGAKAVFSNIKTIIHLANGGNKDEFENYFTSLDARNVNYDIIGASYYPHLSGNIDELQTNLNNVSEKTNKPVMVVETSWGFTDEYIYGVTGNSYSSEDEEVGGYLTSVQAQATMLRDITNVLAKVPNQKGLGIFYWEPGWLPVKYADWATNYGQSYADYGKDGFEEKYDTHGLATWSNQGLFSYTGKALPSLATYTYLKEGHNEANETSTGLRHDLIENYTINTANNEELPKTVKVVTDFDAIREREVVWSNEAIEAVKNTKQGILKGLKGLVEGKYEVSINVKCIRNFVKDPGFEQQGESDILGEPWHLKDVVPANQKVAKLDRKKDIRSGRTDLNWFYSSEEFSLTVYQDVTLPADTYTLTTYVMSIAMSAIAHTRFELFYQIEGQDEVAVSFLDEDHLAGWGDYQECSIEDIVISQESNVRIGLHVAAKAGAWGHNDDWELVSNI